MAIVVERPHLFLTGQTQVGKSTIIRRVCTAHPAWRVGGFRTVTVAQGDTGTVYLQPGEGDGPCDEKNRVGLRWLRERRREAYPYAFDTVGVALLRRAGPFDLLLMDELGSMERDAGEFPLAVLERLDGDTPVLGVVRGGQHTPLLDAVRAHPRVIVLEVTEGNRQTLAVMVNRLMTAAVEKIT